VRVAPQAALFGAPAGPLADDERGRIDYLPGLLAPGEAQAAFEDLRTQVRWKSERRQMYDREVEVPRLTASYRLADAQLPPILARIRERVGQAVQAPFDAVGLNFYRDERDSVAPHNDHLYEIEEGWPIALVSLGAPREMVIRAKAAPRRVLRLELEPGSLLVMSYATQLHYDHGIPKQKNPLGARISLAYRVKGGAGRRY
jgi:alkylated DNA repair dioxygenase AlkB